MAAKQKRYLRYVLMSISLVMVGIVYKKVCKKPEKKLFTVEQPQRRDIEHVVTASGELEIKGIMRVGSLVSGITKEILVKENEHVAQGQLLAIIDNGKEDTDVRSFRAAHKKACAELEYQERFFIRQKALYTSGQLAVDAFERITQNLQLARADVESTSAALRKAEIEYGNTRIYAPGKGIITKVGVSQGERITTDLDATTLFEIGEDTTKMEGSLEIDEGDIGSVKDGLRVDFKVDTYMDRAFTATLERISFSSKESKGQKYYEAIMDVDNSAHLLRPGMTVDASIKIASATSALVITTQAFQVDSRAIKAAAEQMGYNYQPLTSQQKKELVTAGKTVRFVWVVEDKKFIERGLTLGISDDVYFEVISGLASSDNVVVDVEETDEMQKLYKKWFSGAL